MSAPRILVTRAEDVAGERWGDYADRLREAGAEPGACDLAGWRGELPTHYDGLVITAGVDVDPARYGEQRSEYVREVTPERDDFEMALLEDAIARDVPLLAICRGHQLFNVALGGSLLQHLKQREPHRARRSKGGAIDSGWHQVTLAPGSQLAKLFGATSLRVNSRHHQAITRERVAPGLTVAGTTSDGVIEALEHPNHRWAISVQWHAERDEIAVTQRPLFAAFVAACRKHR